MAVAAAAKSKNDGTIQVTLKNPACLNRSWPPSSVAMILLVIAGNMLAYPLWCLLLAKYQEERDSLFKANGSIFVWVLDALSRAILETMPRLVAGSFLLYIGLCAGYVGILSLNE